MRALVLVGFAAACTPEIAPGAYLCGPEQICPEGLACNGTNNICVTESAALPFACGDMHSEIPGDDAPASAQSLGELSCISLVRETAGCLPDGDVGDFYEFRVASNCTDARLRASVVYPIAFQRLVLQLGKVGETPMTIDSECPISRATDAGDAISCLDAAVSSGSYILSVVADGTGDCDGTCKYNRYSLGLQVSTQ